MAVQPDQQLALPGLDASSHSRIDLPDADIVLFRSMVAPAVADEWKQRLLDEPIPWKQDEIALYGRTIPVPRLASWHGDADCSYTYSGIPSQPNPWTPVLGDIRRVVEETTGTRFNSVLVNRYRDGQDSVAWHSDDEPELGRNPVIASVSLGAVRLFQLKHKVHGARRAELALPHGSLLLMRGETQHHWLHQVPKMKQVREVRFNLTFRNVSPGRAPAPPAA